MRIAWPVGGGLLLQWQAVEMFLVRLYLHPCLDETQCCIQYIVVLLFHCVGL